MTAGGGPRARNSESAAAPLRDECFWPCSRRPARACLATSGSGGRRRRRDRTCYVSDHAHGIGGTSICVSRRRRPSFR